MLAYTQAVQWQETLPFHFILFYPSLHKSTQKTYMYQENLKLYNKRCMGQKSCMHAELTCKYWVPLWDCQFACTFWCAYRVQLVCKDKRKLASVVSTKETDVRSYLQAGSGPQYEAVVAAEAAVIGSDPEAPAKTSASAH